jgi:hypothetical protein
MKSVINLTIASVAIVSLMFVMAATQTKSKVNVPKLKVYDTLSFKKVEAVPPKELVKELSVLKKNMKTLEIVKLEAMAEITTKKAVSDSNQYFITKGDSVYLVKEDAGQKEHLRL